jgi:hypothetical protein
MIGSTDLHVEVQGGDIVVTLPGSIYAVTYHKPANSPPASRQVIPDEERSICRDDIGRVSRPSLESSQ